ncbi:MFS transporter [Streptosporangium pseudovulgare]|uniref:MFS transporter n=1 Tax=Streptosporangium pseudovulgare TaxID=35765 RepID=A0ABQ2RIB1_9ACTN|nr:MFS transporter [Streptosporangium pseudovulgare]GGQ32553.1 MFS transporter [Streptosporangium pseudovulgare]
MRRSMGGRESRRGKTGLLAQLRRPPGGGDARTMLLAQFLDRTGSGVWSASSVLYFTFVAGLDAGRLGLLLSAAGVMGIAGSPLAGRLAGRFPVRSLLIGCHLLRIVTLCLMLVCTGFEVLLPVVAATYVADRAAKTLEMLFATRVAGERCSTYRALSRSAANAGYALGAGISAIGLAVGTHGAYHALILCDALSFLAAAVLVWRTREPRGPEHAAARPDGAATAGTPSPWRDRGYLLFVLLDVPMNLDDSILNVGLPLWLVGHTAAPHALVPAFLVINTVLVVVLQIHVSARIEEPRRAAAAVALYGLTVLACCALLAIATGGSAWTASIAMLVVAVLITSAELMRSTTSWELAVSLAPQEARAAYLGVAGMSQGVQKSAGPLLLTGAVTAAGPVGWLALGAAVAGLSAVQRRVCLRRLASGPAATGVPATSPATPAT